MQDSDTGINTIFKVLIHRVSQCIVIIGCIHLNNMTYILIILKVQVRSLSWHWIRIGLKKKVGPFCNIFTLFKYRNISLYRDIFGAIHRYFQILYRPSLIVTFSSCNRLRSQLM